MKFLIFLLSIIVILFCIDPALELLHKIKDRMIEITYLNGKKEVIPVTTAVNTDFKIFEDDGKYTLKYDNHNLFTWYTVTDSVKSYKEIKF